MPITLYEVILYSACQNIKHPVASRSDAEHFGKELFALATNIGIYKETITNQEIVFIGDGAVDLEISKARSLPPLSCIRSVVAC